MLLSVALSFRTSSDSTEGVDEKIETKVNVKTNEKSLKLTKIKMKRARQGLVI